MLSTVYRMLVLNLGIPPKEFDFVRKDAEGKPDANAAIEAVREAVINGRQK